MNIQTLIRQFLMCCLCSSVSSAELYAPADSVGMSTDRLQRIDTHIQTYIDAKQLVGAVVIVARNGSIVHSSALGYVQPEIGKVMNTDQIFKIASMTKPIIGVSILMLIEEGKLRLQDPVSKYIPEFDSLRVAIRTDQDKPLERGVIPDYSFSESDRQITILDLLTHVSGLGSGPMSNAEIAKIAKIDGETLADYIPRLGGTALEFQPGSRWAYSAFAGFDTLGRIIEIASGLPLDKFLEERIFKPLNMSKTTFWPEDDDWDTIAPLYRSGATGSLQKSDNIIGNSSAAFFSGGGGLMSSAEDYIKFGMMLANEGEWNGVRLLSPNSVEMMKSVFVPDTIEGRRPGEGFGLSVRVVSDHVKRGTFLSTGTYGWLGATGTFFFIDPVQKLVGVLMVQTPNGQLNSEFETLVAQSVISK